ncbi:MAG TPA: RHS repeat-associated core domain-containing protein [Bryobacteraceae bacterium]|nr:RHS repeat-associated core domain-containing protein [Bryobacteraceae bacterium]
MKYATYTRDSATGLDYADQRYYSNQFARFMTADPYRAMATSPSDPKNPQSWNHYSYGEGDPVNHNDPTGLDICDFASDFCIDVWGIPQIDMDINIAGQMENLLNGLSNLANLITSGLAARQFGISNLAGVARQLKRGVASGQETDCQAMADFASAAAGQDSAAGLVVADFQVLTPNQTPIWAVPGVQGQSGNNLVILGNNPGQTSGFQSQYQDSIFPNQDQTHHFAAFLQLGYSYGILAVPVANLWELLEGTPGNVGDIALGQAAVKAGAMLANGTLKPSDLADWIRQNICQH